MIGSGDYDLPAADHIGLFVITFPTPPSYTASSVSCKSGEIVTSGFMAHKAIATVLQNSHETAWQGIMTTPTSGHDSSEFLHAPETWTAAYIEHEVNFYAEPANARLAQDSRLVYPSSSH